MGRVRHTQKNTEVDRLLTDLGIDVFKIEYFIPPDSKKPGGIREWFATHDAPWHRAYYALLAKHWDALRRAHNRLRKLPMVRTRSGKYRSGAQCHFANDEGATPEGVTLVDPDTYSRGKRAEDAKKGLNDWVVSELDDESRDYRNPGQVLRRIGASPNLGRAREPPEDLHRIRAGRAGRGRKARRIQLASGAAAGAWLPPGRVICWERIFGRECRSVLSTPQAANGRQGTVRD